MKTTQGWLSLLACLLAASACPAWAQDEDTPSDLDEPFVDPLAGKLQPAPMPGSEPAAEEGVPSFDTDKFQLTWGGRVQTDLRFRVIGKRMGSYYTRPEAPYGPFEAPTGVSRNENTFKLKLDAVYGRFGAKLDMDFVYLGMPDKVNGVEDLSERGKVDPFYLQAHAAYIEATDLFFDGLDLRVGQQLVQWGMADQFNPTNNLNSADMEDILLFGEQMANLMVKLDYSPLDSLTLSGVLVPIYKPALLPRTGPLALAASDRMPMSETRLRHRLIFEKALGSDLAGYETVVATASPILPDTSFENMQAGGRIGLSTDWIDAALSYYYGRNDFPVPMRNYTVQDATIICDPDNGADCISGRLMTEVSLTYPRQHVFGLNAAGEIPLDWMVDQLGGIGWRLELGVYLPEKIRMELSQAEITLAGQVQPAGEYDYDGDGQPGGPRPTVVDDQPFVKWTLGLDYSFGRWVYLNLMWVHGMVDEFGAGDFFSEGWNVRQSGLMEGTEGEILPCLLANAREVCGERMAHEVFRPKIGDYLAVVIDTKFLEDRGLFRLFFMWDLSGYYESFYDEAQGKRVQKYLSLFGDGFSAILYPELDYNFGNGLELSVGALFQFGKDYTKFGDPAAGGSLVWTRARYSW
ncbi:MAG TPA: hypothetical protein PK668_07970 [Myxococcota bacterium]|nr:hypothetical protein [Myxococcota bacterium]HRY93089.1 hypothetical protein [Myxococcota bacterium]HSA20094.1 hypothetical protein [Myxococcota bacterium]